MELAEKYGEYKTEKMKQLAVSFFEDHKSEEWLQDRYHPPAAYKFLKAQSNEAKDLFAKFEEEFLAGEVPHINENLLDILKLRLDALENEPEAELEEGETKPEGADSAKEDLRKRIKELEEEAKVAAEKAAAAKAEADGDVTDKKESDENDGDEVITRRRSGDDDEEDEEEEAERRGATPEDGGSEPKDTKKEKKKNNQIADSTIYLGLLPASVHSDHLLKVIKGLPGFGKLIFSQAQIPRHCKRHAWAQFDSDENCLAAIEKLTNTTLDDGTQINAQPKTRRTPNAVRPISAFTLLPARVTNDLALAIELAKHLDGESDLSPGFASIEEKVQSYEEELQRLNAVLMYLRRVHNFCFYCVKEQTGQSDVNMSCYEWHPRLAPTSLENPSEDKQGQAATTRIRKRMERVLPEVMKEDKEEEMRDAFFKENIVEDQGNQRCSFCSKLFNSEQFVLKHMKNRHSFLATQHVAKEVESQFKDNFLRDPCHETILHLSFKAQTQLSNRRDSFNSRRGSNQRHSMGRTPSHMGPPPPWSQFSARVGGGNDRRGSGQHDGYRGGRDNNNRRSTGGPRRTSDSFGGRSIRSYNDLDSPSKGKVEIDYGLLLDSHDSSKK